MNKTLKKTIRKQRVVKKVKKVTTRPRLHVYRSNKHMYAQVIDRSSGKIIASASDADVKTTKTDKSSKAEQVGKLVAEKALKAKIKEVAFDRGANKYHGRVKALAEAARKAGLQF
ncbi:50S ribosomal protein L18 [Patescibacteria group bacterium]